MRSSPSLAAVAIIGVLVLAGAQRPVLDPAGVTLRELPIQFPVVGNLDAVQQWQVGRLQEVQATAGNEVILGIRLANGSLVRVVGPGAQLNDLARRSNWFRSPGRSFPGRGDWMERMVAFDADRDGRIIAIASLEPVARNPNRLRRALDT